MQTDEAPDMADALVIRPLGVRLVCEACGEESLVAFPARVVRYGVVDCPCCSCTYLVIVDGGPAKDGTAVGRTESMRGQRPAPGVQESVIPGPSGGRGAQPRRA
jgi:hypothetical protein